MPVSLSTQTATAKKCVACLLQWKCQLAFFAVVFVIVFDSIAYQSRIRQTDKQIRAPNKWIMLLRLTMSHSPKHVQTMDICIRVQKGEKDPIQSAVWCLCRKNTAVPVRRLIIHASANKLLASTLTHLDLPNKQIRDWLSKCVLLNFIFLFFLLCCCKSNDVLSINCRPIARRQLPNC